MPTNGMNKTTALADIFASITALTGAGICMYDLKQHFGPDYKDLHNRHGGHRSAFCQYVREDLAEGYATCIQSDGKDALLLAQEYRQPFFHTCHAGLTEIVVPVLHKNEMVALAFCGQCRLQTETQWTKVLNQVQHLQPEESRLHEYYRQLPLLDRSTLTNAGKLLDISLRYLVELHGNQVWHDLIDSKSQDPVQAAERFIAEHYATDITASDVARHVHLSHPHLARLFQKRLGHTITDLIIQKRVAHARRLLSKTGIPVQSIAYNVGYKSYRHFLTVFQRLTGQNPSQYRARVQRSERRESQGES